MASTSEHTTLYTDETRKHGQTYETYIISDELQNSCLLGLREMSNKSGRTTLDTFKEILQDISEHCDRQGNFGTSYQLLKNIKNTMSDRASTEKTFNGLLRAYIQECLAQIVDNYNELSTEEADLCAQMNIFFCGLHLLVAMADVCETSLKLFEKNFEPDYIGSAVNANLKRYQKNESGTMRLLRTCSKVCAVGEDEKSGAHLPWKTYLGSKNQKNRIMRFRHNRFNMVFMVGAAVFYHADDLSNFLDKVHGTSNDFLKAVALDVKEDLYIAGSKSLGLISKFVTAPLWRLIEAPGHILDLNMQLKTLKDFFHLASVDSEKAMQFMTGEITPFQTPLDDKDMVMTKLIEENKVAEFVLPMLQNMFMALSQMLVCMIPEHLPGGKFWNVTDTLKTQSASVKKHNKMPEFVFGQLDHLITFSPNASLLTNEAYIMYAFNKTGKWLDQLSKEVKEKYLEESRKEGMNKRKKIKERTKIIQQQLVEQQRQKQLELGRKERARIKKEESMTNDVCYYGLWQSKQHLEEGLAALGESNKGQEAALKSQLRFRKNVLKLKPMDNKKVCNFSVKGDNGKYKNLSIEELKKNVLSLVASAADVDAVEVKQGKVPLFVGKEIEHKFKDKSYRGEVISIVPGFPEWYNVKYEQDEAIYVFNLKQDYSNGDLKIIVN